VSKDQVIQVAMAVCVLLGAAFWATLASRHTKNPTRKRPVWLGVFLGLLALVFGLVWYARRG
jgi:sterol desaturase/sphingolipid hydroxylase (fatty acid hydroxylase superfamily)